MLILRLFGGFAAGFERGSLSGPASQKKRLAVLSLLATAPTGRLSRDALVALLWPESDFTHARHQLASSIYELRRASTPELILSVGDDLQLAADLVDSDVAEFENALRQARWQDAVRLYRGPFLDGFFVSDAPAFERWAADERERLARACAGALEALALAAEERGDRAAAVEWWRARAAHDPYDSRVAVRLMQALAAGGNRAAALQHAALHERRLRAELEIDSPPEIRALAQRLRGEPATRMNEEQVPSSTPVAASGSTRGIPIDAGATTISAVLPAVRPFPDRLRTVIRSQRYAMRIGTAAIVAALLGATVWTFTSSPAPRPETGNVAVFPFIYRGSEGRAYLSEAIPELLSSYLEGSELESVDPRIVANVRRGVDGALDRERARAMANRLGADRFVLGSVIESGGRLEVTAALYDRLGNRTGAARAAVPREAQVFELAEALARQLLAGVWGRQSDLTRVAGHTTSSVAALKAFYEGEAEFRAGRFARAIDAYQRAVTADSAYALAWYRISLVSAYALQPELSEAAAAAASRHAGALPEPDRRLLAAQLHMLEGEIPLAEQQYREFLSAYPDDAEAWIGLGFIQLIINPWRGRPLSEARSSLERAITLQPQYRNALMPLAYVAATEHRYADYAELIRRVGPDQDFWPVLRALEVFATGSDAEKATMLADLRGIPDVLLYQAARFVALKTTDWAGAAEIARQLTESSRPVEVRATGHVILANLELAQGRRAAAEAELESTARLDPEMALEQRALMALVPFLPVSPERLGAVRAAIADWDPAGAGSALSAGPRSLFPPHRAVRPLIREYLLGMLSLRLGDEAAALRSITALDAKAEGGAVDPLAQDLARYLRAYRAQEQGRLADALALLASGEVKRPFRYLNFQSPFYANFLERYRHGELLAAAGRLEEALPWLAMVAEASAEGLVFSAPSHRLQAMIYDRLGEHEQAAGHYRRFLELWQDCDPEFQEMVAEVRGRLAGR